MDLRGKNTLFTGTFSQITFRFSGKTEYFYRNYQKVPATVANIAGVSQLVILITKIFTYFFSKNSMLNYLIFQFFEYENIKEELENEKELILNTDNNKFLRMRENFQAKTLNDKREFGIKIYQNAINQMANLSNGDNLQVNGQNKNNEFEKIKNPNLSKSKMLKIKLRKNISSKVEIKSLNNDEKHGNSINQDRKLNRLIDINNNKFQEDLNISLPNSNKSISNLSKKKFITENYNLINKNSQKQVSNNPNREKIIINNKLLEKQRNKSIKNIKVNDSINKDASDANIFNYDNNIV